MQKFPQKYSTQLRLDNKGSVQTYLPVDNSYMFIYDEYTKRNYQGFDDNILLIGSKTELIPVYELKVNEHCTRLSMQPLQMQFPVLKSNSKFISHY
ncbi:hypothetical protein TTHERM_000002619 (macronuclear) [Tetrahymena thermophila SB210]|uniref:Uncharacterized protein n=1 Tax=Tetrahymena thermophila (strain SB210) TaxID=312017 RepID=W7XGX0_TETTS|nr:hypothetical protein TTHERM_000002619 [Tetrahymena thermophila SB210]EWS76298.1 hypothetical protein TTHERM_000002619 [Tetrahymena thermophila SB210]|eukprot:XP_012651082.1 hypothetical protein TTHERM_000002619 [Tetrahymena thermophila SB210]